MTTSRLGAFCLYAYACDQMAAFYRAVFGVALEPQRGEDGTIWSGDLSGIEFTLVPAAMIEGLTTRESKFHLDLWVDDLDAVVAQVAKHGGRTNGRMVEDGGVRCIGVYDPDGNFMPVKQRVAA